MSNSTQFTTIILAGYIDIGNIKYFYFTLLTVLYVAIIFANVTLIGLICVERTLHEPMYVLLCSLCVNELYGSTAFFPAFLINLLSSTHEIAIAFCYVQIFSLYTYAAVEYCNLAVMSYDRYVSICYPLQYGNIMTGKNVFILIVLIWMVSFVKFTITLSLNLRLQLCGNILEKVWCDNYLMVKLACSDSTVNNIYGIVALIPSVIVPVVLILYSYIKILKVCLRSSKETTQKAMNTCTPHLVSLMNFSLGCSFEIFQSRFDKVHMPNVLRVVISVYFVICPPLLNPVMYGIRMSKIRKVLSKSVYRIRNSR
ncbi:olfactory receptor 52E4-like [Chanos chanos]|uniref:Olfactory receptor n=1 Tax=Chanos chanos TaxID=29144 RepID=A0A6J2VLA8_CHACN|nr:olfactory receptor 52E4-like [Chanos chanos]